MGLKRACGAFLSPLRWSAERRTTTPVPSSKEGNYGAGKQIFSNLQLARCEAADPWLWLAGLAVYTEREGVPLPRSGGGREGADAPAAPYKHRLAHAASGATSAYVVLTLRYTTGSPPRCGAPSFPHKVLRPCGGPRRSRSGRAFRCVGFLGRSPKPFLHPFVGTKGCPRRAGVQTVAFCKAFPAERREETMIKRLRGGWGAGLRFAEEEPAAGVIGRSHSWGRW